MQHKKSSLDERWKGTRKRNVLLQSMAISRCSGWTHACLHHWGTDAAIEEVRSFLLRKRRSCSALHARWATVQFTSVFRFLNVNYSLSTFTSNANGLSERIFSRNVVKRVLVALVHISSTLKHVILKHRECSSTGSEEGKWRNGSTCMEWSEFPMFFLRPRVEVKRFLHYPNWKSRLNN